LDIVSVRAPSYFAHIGSGTQAVVKNTLKTWSFANVPDGDHAIVLEATSTSGVHFEDRLLVTVDSAAITSPSTTWITGVHAGASVPIMGSFEPANFSGYGVSVTGQKTGPLSGAQITLAQ